MVKKIFIYVVFCLMVLSAKALASDLPKLLIKTTPKSNPLNYNNTIYHNNIYQNNCSYYGYNCLYSTTLSTKELRARRKARKQAKLEAEQNVIEEENKED